MSKPHKTHCKHGHEFTEDNTFRYTRNGTPRRHCKTCLKVNWTNYRSKKRAEYIAQHGEPIRYKTPVRHGHAYSKRKTPTYRAWSGMRSRCTNPNNTAYKNYGARGITVCDRWAVFENFLADMGEAPPGKSLDRIDNSGPYSPENCRWATWQEQCLNKRANKYLEFNGMRLCIRHWERRLGLSVGVLHKRLQKGWPIEKVLSEKHFNGK